MKRGKKNSDQRGQTVDIKILYEDEHILVCVKPVGIATQTAKLAAQDMVSLIKNYLVQKGFPRNPYLGIVHRLDQPVSGILVFAKTKEAAAGLSRQLKDEAAGKEYLALCLGRLPRQEGEFVHYLKKDKAAGMAVVTKQEDKEGKQAVLSYHVEREEENSTLVRIRLKTGRFHQIRAQFLAAGYPLLGDGRYKTAESEGESCRRNIRSVALCAVSLSFDYPIADKKRPVPERMNFTLDKEDLPAW